MKTARETDTKQIKERIRQVETNLNLTPKQREQAIREIVKGK